jgi:hypothetical protein
MRTTSSRLSVFALVLVLTTAAAAPAFAMQREGPGGGDNPIVRIVKQLMRKFGIMPNDEQPSVPHP